MGGKTPPSAFNDTSKNIMRYLATTVARCCDDRRTIL